jgi:hypothetical protein
MEKILSWSYLIGLINVSLPCKIDNKIPSNSNPKYFIWFGNSLFYPRDLLEDFEVLGRIRQFGKSIPADPLNTLVHFRNFWFSQHHLHGPIALEKTRSSQVLPSTYFHFCRVSIIPRLWLQLFAASLSAPRGVTSSRPMS